MKTKADPQRTKTGRELVSKQEKGMVSIDDASTLSFLK